MDTIPQNPEQSPAQFPRSPGVYRILNTTNGHSYIGSTTNLHRRTREHLNYLRKNKNRSIHLQRAFNVYGEAAFVPQILEHVSDPSLLEEREQYWMDLLKPEYNVRRFAANNNGVSPSEETRRKIADSLRGRPGVTRGRKASEAERKRARERQIGKHPSAETRAKISTKNRGRKRSPETCERIGNTHRGKEVWSEESRRKISESNKRRPKNVYTEESRRKIGNAHRGKITSPETRAKLSASQKGRPAHNKGTKHTPEAKAKMSAARKGKPGNRKGIPHSTETRAKLSEIGTGRPWSPLRRARFEAKREAQRQAQQENQSPSLWNDEDMA